MRPLKSKEEYVVTDGCGLYFRKWDDINQPGILSASRRFDSLQEAQKVADALGWRVRTATI
ncbi:hypothetical protein M102_gp22 [Streptococcus phage M102]|uniref:hypothetical protein n=1 Tax=Streptococcus phage M102 TaxID=372457 RepID=UPI00015968D2|nr:hypothetical protein M102_gp22 [Streptococcus phage M102]CAO77372.1 hypothetical protein [Streptococcus phage M102]